VNLAPVFRFLGWLLWLLAAAMAVPLLCSLLYGENGAAMAFLASGAITAGCGTLFYRAGAGDAPLYRPEGILIVVGGWVLATVFGSLPYLLTGTFHNPVDAVFESASGFTTTGASVMLEIEAFGRGILFWRSFTQWLGGMGIIVLFVALLPQVGPGARFLYKLEVPGPTSEALRPRIRDAAAQLWKIYILLTVTQTLLLLLAGMDLYDALTHTFSTLSTGGFSPRNASTAAFGPLVQVVIIVFMLIAGANFSLYHGLWQRRGLGIVRRDPEFRIYVMVILAVTLVISANLLLSSQSEGHDWPLLDSLFQVVSIITTTGYVTADFDAWPEFSRMLLVGLMFVGGCAGSTSGSMKIMRAVIASKAAFREVRLLFRPSAVVKVFVGARAVPNSVVGTVVGFVILFLLFWGVGMLGLTLGGTDLITAATASIATLGNVGPGLGAVGPKLNFAAFAGAEKMLMVVLMLLGRLEVYAIAALFVPRFWRP
jgi:trk system potassium uptake protein TrkH